MTVVLESPPQTEAERVEANMLKHFHDLGFAPVEVVKLNAARADWHVLSRALERGCTHAQAVRIYGP